MIKNKAKVSFTEEMAKFSEVNSEMIFKKVLAIFKELWVKKKQK